MNPLNFQTTSCILGILYLTVTFSPAFGQSERGTSSPQETPEFRVQVDIVPVDVIVTDEWGRPVLNLDLKDFIILENGVPQDISHFTLQTFTQRSQTQAPVSVPGTEPQIEPQENRTFLIMLGRGRHNKFENLNKLARFLREELNPEDQAAVMAYNRTTAFTTDHESLASLVERYRQKHEKIEAALKVRLRGLAEIYGAKEVPKSLQASIDEIFDLPQLSSSRVIPAEVQSPEQALDEREAQEAVIYAERAEMLTAAGAPADNFSDLRTMELEALTDLPFEEYMATRAQTDSELMNIFGALEYLRFKDGEKHLLFFTEKGLFLPDMEDDKSLAAMASDARVRVHNLHTAGVDLGAEVTLKQASGGRIEFQNRSQLKVPRAASDHSFALGSLRNVSSLTGGRAFISADIDRALGSIEETTRAVYLLGYRPKNTDFDGDYRRIEVKIKKEGHRAQARGGYYARIDPVPYDSEQLRLYSRTVGAATYDDSIEDVDFSLLLAEPVVEQSNTRLDILLRIQLREEMFSKEAGLHRGQLAITFFIFSDKGQLLGDQWDDMKLNLDEDQYQGMLNGGIPIKRVLRVGGEFKNGIVKAVVYDPSTDKVGSRQVKIG